MDELDVPALRDAFWARVNLLLPELRGTAGQSDRERACFSVETEREPGDDACDPLPYQLFVDAGAGYERAASWDGTATGALDLVLTFADGFAENLLDDPWWGPAVSSTDEPGRWEFSADDDPREAARRRLPPHRD